MAELEKNTRVKKSVEEKIDTKVLDSDCIDSLQKENVSLKQELDSIKNQMNLLLNMFQAKEEKNKGTNNEKYITFVNLTKGKFIIKGSVVYTIDKQFETRRFLEREAKIIVNNMPNSIHQGQLYIADSEFVKDCDLDLVYKTLLSDSQLKELLEQSSDTVLEIYKNASSSQKEIIVDMIENKKLNNCTIDANILLEIGKLANKNLIDIEPI